MITPHPDYHREINEKALKDLETSIRMLGQQVPIKVVSDGSSGYRYIDGGHRYEVIAKRLNHDTIQVEIFKGDAHHVELWFIDANLARADLTDEEHDRWTERRVVLRQEIAAAQQQQQVKDGANGT